MPIDPRIPLMGNTQQVFDSVNQHQSDLARLGLAQQQEKRLAKSQALQDEVNQETLVQKKYENLDAREKSRVNSVILAGVELGTYLDSGDMEGAENFLQNRKKAIQKRIANGENLDTRETDAALKRLKEDPATLKKQVESLKQWGVMTGILQQPKPGAGMVQTTDPETGEITLEPARKLSATDTKEIYEASDSIQAAGNAKSAMTRASTIMEGGATGQEPKPYSGFGASARAAAARLPDWLVPDAVASKERGAATTEYSNLVNEQALSNLKAIFGGNPTEGERQILLQMQAIADYTPEEQKKIINNAIQAADRRMQFNKGKIKSIQTGDYGALGQTPEQPASGGIKFLQFVD